MKVDLIKTLDAQNVKSEMPVIRIGDTVRVHIKIKEGTKERIQIFEGTVIAKKHGRCQRDLHCSPYLLWRRCGKGVPGSLPQRGPG